MLSWNNLARLGLRSENLTLGFPENVGGRQRNSNLPTSRHGRRNCLHQSQMTAGKPQEKEEWIQKVELKSEKDEIKFEDFDKVENPLEVKKWRNASKDQTSASRFRLDAGDGEDRQILSGIAILSKRTRVVGKKLPSRSNLKPRR